LSMRVGALLRELGMLVSCAVQMATRMLGVGAKDASHRHAHIEVHRALLVLKNSQTFRRTS
jgi:hypothetical protein